MGFTRAPNGVISLPENKIGLLMRGEHIVTLDATDYDLVKQYRWRIEAQSRAYARTNQGIGGGKLITFSMHRLLMDFPTGDVDHIDGNGLNNSRSNIRLATRSENGRNRGKQLDNTSGFKGVVAFPCGWRARIGISGKRHHLGYFNTPEDAAHAYDVAALQLHGEFAHLNFPEAA